jgi:hypothetical protein
MLIKEIFSSCWQKKFHLTLVEKTLFHLKPTSERDERGREREEKLEASYKNIDGQKLMMMISHL